MLEFVFHRYQRNCAAAVLVSPTISCVLACVYMLSMYVHADRVACLVLCHRMPLTRRNAWSLPRRTDLITNKEGFRIFGFDGKFIGIYFAGQVKGGTVSGKRAVVFVALARFIGNCGQGVLSFHD